MLLTMVQVLGGWLAAHGTKTRGGGRRDSTRLNTREATLTNITLCPTLLEGDVLATIGMELEREVDVVMGALHGRLVVATESMVLPGEVHTVCEHMDLGLHYVLVAIPRVANENHQLSERGYRVAVHGLGGE